MSARNTESEVTGRSRDVAVNSDDHFSHEPEYDDRPVKNPMFKVIGILTVGLVAGFGIYTAKAIAANTPKVISEVSAPDVEAKVKSVDVGIQPVTVSTTLSDTATTIENSDTVDVAGLKVPIQYTKIIRTAEVEGEYTFDPKEVTASFDAAAEKVSISIPKTALSTKVSVVTGTGKTQNAPQFGIKWAIDNMSEFIQTADAILGTDSSKDPILGQVINGSLGTTETLESIADLKAAQAVDENCTSQVRSLDGFDEAIIHEVDTLATKEILASTFLEEKNYSFAERRALIENAELVFEGGTQFTINHDETTKKRVDAYAKLFPALTSVGDVSCKVDDSTQFTINGEAPNDER